ncbi:MAG: hypothetical protein NUK54_10945, partial [Methanothrix sp.]|nr:hypothetical protein [Methanothrix sp.]
SRYNSEKSSFLHKLLYMALICLLLFFSQTPALASCVDSDGNLSVCAWCLNCNSENYGYIVPYLAKIDGSPIGGCVVDEDIEVYVWVEFSNSAQDKGSSFLVFDIYINDVLYEDHPFAPYQIYECIGTDGLVISGTTINQIVYGPINIKCGDNVSLVNVTLTWLLSGVSSCEKIKCKGQGYNRPPGNCWQNETIFVQTEPPGTISGYKWEDLDGDGMWDRETEPGLGGWIITIQNETWSNTTQTDSSGFYAFRNLSYGETGVTYQISETLKSGWEQTFPDAGYHTVTLTPTNRVEDEINFGNFFNASYALNKTVEFDSYQNGTQVNYTIWINNTGKANLTEVLIEDYLEGTPTPLYQTYGDDSDGILSVSEKWRYEFNITVDDSFFRDPCNDWINNTVITNFSARYNETRTIYIDHQDWANVTIYKCQTADAGKDQIVCGGDPVFLEGNASCYDDVAWTNDSSCLGELDWPIDGDSLLNATYTPPYKGELSGYCNLTFTATGTGPCADVSDNVTIYVVESPTAVIRVIKPEGYS